jgi:hypothetical protein
MTAYYAFSRADRRRKEAVRAWIIHAPNLFEALCRLPDSCDLMDLGVWRKDTSPPFRCDAEHEVMLCLPALIGSEQPVTAIFAGDGGPACRDVTRPFLS